MYASFTTDVWWHIDQFNMVIMTWKEYQYPIKVIISELLTDTISAMVANQVADQEVQLLYSHKEFGRCGVETDLEAVRVTQI